MMKSIQARAFARATHDVRSELKLAIEPVATFDEASRSAERAPAFIRLLPERVDELFVSDAILEPYSALAFNIAGSFEDELLARGRQLVQERLAGPSVDLDALQAELGALFEDRFSDARLENIARTEFAKAYNAGRTDLMLGDDVADLVVGMQYSAVIDSRTTDYCDAWDGVVIARDDTASIAKYGPPAHYQCRSMWVPVTTFDDIPVTPREEWPSIQPMAGFGGTE